MTDSKTFAIIGGGIGGLTTAIALRKKGFNATVYESAPAFQPIGAGIVLAPNAIKAFQSIGMDQQIISAGSSIMKFLIRDSLGATLSSTESEDLQLRFGVSGTVALHRADLHRVLLNQLPEGCVVNDKLCTGFCQEQDGVTVQFADGSSIYANHVIAADGIHSVFRKKLIPETSLRYSGYACWRGVVDNQPLGVGNGEASEFWGPGKRFGMVPLPNARTYWYATLNVQEPEAKIFSADKPELRALFSEFDPIVDEIIAGTDDRKLIRNDIFDFKPVKEYAFHNIVLTGDAAHATTPNLGQGACMAIEDAVVLASCIEREHNVMKAFKNFEARRVARNSKIVNASYSMGKIAQITNPFLTKLRNIAMRLTPKSINESQLKFLYDVSFDDSRSHGSRL